MEKLKLKFVREKQTKNTWRFREDESEFEASVGVIYVRKETLGQPVPERLIVTIQEDSGSQR